LFLKVCQLYGISNDLNPDIDVFSLFSCSSADPNSDEFKAVVKHLLLYKNNFKLILENFIESN
jgi:hypothetical protein